jgi:hypothetical protein
MTTADFTRLVHAGFRGEVRAGLDCSRLLERLGPDPVAAIAAAPDAALVKTKEDKGSRVYRLTADIGRGEEELFVKVFDGARTYAVMRERMRGSEQAQAKPHHYPVKLIKMLWSPRLARRSFRAAAACGRAGAPVAEHLLWLSRRRGFFFEELLVTAGVNPRSATNAKNYFRENFPLPCPPERLAEKRELLQILGVLLRRAQDSGLTFQDFKLHNLVLEESRPPVFRVIDLAEVTERSQDESLFIRRFLPSITRPPVLTALDRLRLVRAYLDAGADRRRPDEFCRQVLKPGADESD